MTERILKILIPKGSLQESVESLLKTTGYKVSRGSRGYRPVVNDPEIEMKMLRPQEIPNYLKFILMFHSIFFMVLIHKANYVDQLNFVCIPIC